MGGGRREREREHAEYEFMRKRKKTTTTTNKQKTCFRSDLGKGRRLPIPNIPGDEWDNQSTWGKNPLVRCSANPMILILMRVSLPSKLRKTITRERETHTHIHSHTIIYAYNILMQYYGKLQ